MVKQHDLSITMLILRVSPLPFKEKLKRLREIGFQSIQSSLPPEAMSLAEYKAYMDELGIEAACFMGRPNMVLGNPVPWIEACHAFDCDEIQIGTLPDEYRGSYEGYRQGAEAVNKAARIFKKEGISIAYHNHCQEFRKFSNGKRGIDVLWEDLDPDAVHFLPDTHWLQAAGIDILYWLGKCKGRMQYLHVKDYRIGPANYLTPIGYTDKQYSQIGDGNLPWEAIIQKGKECGVKVFIVEQDDCYGQDPYECAAQSYAKLKSLGLS
jgi:sugar phosphate isomerase/epimerase